MNPLQENRTIANDLMFIVIITSIFAVMYLFSVPDIIKYFSQGYDPALYESEMRGIVQDFFLSTLFFIPELKTALMAINAVFFGIILWVMSGRNDGCHRTAGVVCTIIGSVCLVLSFTPLSSIIRFIAFTTVNAK